MAFESCVVPEDWRSAVIVPLYKGRGERTECKKYRGYQLVKCYWKNIKCEVHLNGFVQNM